MTEKIKNNKDTEAFSKDIDKGQIEEVIHKLLNAVGEDADRDGLKGTPERIGRMYGEILGGYRQDPDKVINGALFEVDYDDMVIVRDIEFFSLCEHHMLPFMGRAHVAYIPSGKVIGLSKIPRVVDMFSRRLQVQERMTRQIADFLIETIDPLGVGVIVEGLHLCSMMRGVRKHDARMTTTTMMGNFRDNAATRQEFLDSVSRGAQPLQF